MFEERSPKLDLFALLLLAAGLFLGIALATYDKTDPPSQLVYPASEVVHNACGRSGALVAHGLFTALGLGAYYLWWSLVAMIGLLLLRKEIDQPVVRSGGWALSLVAISTLAALLLPNWSPGPVVGSGGYVGALGRMWLENNLASAGAFIFTLSVLLAGLLLCTDYFLFAFAAKTTQVSAQRLIQLGQSATQRRLRPTTDLEPAFAVAAGPVVSALAVKTPASKASKSVAADEDEKEVEDAAEKSVGIKVKTPTSKTPVVEEDDKKGKPSGIPLLGETTINGEEAQAPTAASPGEKGKSTLNYKKPKEPGKVDPRDEIIGQLEAAEVKPESNVDYQLPPLDLLLQGEQVSYEEHEKEVRRKARILEQTFQNFGFAVKVVEIETGPVIAQYEVELEAGLRLSKITGLADDLAIALRVPSVRIVAPIPGKNTVGIEVPNEHRQLVRMREVIEETNGRAKRMKIPLYLGKDVAGNPMVVDLTALPHLLIAGRTGTGKSVCLNTIIVSMLMSRGPDEVRMLMIDPKMVELSGYRKLPHLMHPVVTDMRKAEAILAWGVDKMEERYALLARAGVRHITVYNQLSEEELRSRIQPENDEEWKQVPKQLPFIVIVADEIADLMMTAGKDVEQHIIRLAQKSRAVGIHLILATQKPTVDVITGLIKSNLPARIAFQVASRVDSRVVLDEMGADKLLGNGDMLFLSPGTSMLLRGQGTFLSDDEITRVVDFVGTDEQQFAGELMQLKTKDETGESAGPGNFKARDELYEAAIDLVVRERRGSVSLLQRGLGIGYGRAARLIDFMAEDGFVGQYNGSQAREIMISIEDWEAMTAGSDSSSAAPVTPATSPLLAKRNNKIMPETDEEEDEEEEEADEEAPWEEDAEDAEEEVEEWEGEEEEEGEWEEEEEEEKYRADSA